MRRISLPHLVLAVIVSTLTTETYGQRRTFPTTTTTPTAAPTPSPSPGTTATPMETTTEATTAATTEAPTAAPTEATAEVPTAAPTEATKEATPTSPTTDPTATPMETTTAAPTDTPSLATTPAPTEVPTASPTTDPTATRMETTTAAPTDAPSLATTPAPTEAPTADTTADTTATPTEASTALPSPDPVYCDRQYSCLDCTTARVCAPTADGTRLYEIDQVTCPPSAPACDFDTGTCTNNASPGCPQPPVVADNICMRDGIFPDPINCSRYFKCRQGQSVTYDCPQNAPYYEFMLGTCITSNGYCFNSYNQCQGQSGLKVSSGWGYSSTYSYFLYCDNNTAVAVDRCIGANQFDQYYQRCVPYCPYSGLYPSQDSCSEYYKCTSNNPVCYGCGDYTLTNMTCPAGQGFSEAEFQCVDRSLAPNCNVTNSDFFNKR